MTGLRGRVEARAVVLDVRVLGEAEAVRRALDLWRPGASVRALPDGAWLVLLGEPIEVRAERAPGLPVSAEDCDEGEVRLTRAGSLRTLRLADLPEVDPAGWVDLSSLPMVRLEPLVRPVAIVAAVAPPPATPAPDLRALAGVTPPGKRADRVLRELRGEPAAGFGGGIGFGRGGAAGGGGGRLAGFAAEWLARSVLRSPAGPLVRRRHAAYLRTLIEQFERRNWDDALRDAIGLTGGAGGVASLRLPGRRKGMLRPTGRLPGGGRLTNYGPDIAARLASLYRDAAADLERAGRVEEAAFVLADLIGDVAEAVALLERHGQYRLAAELAEGRDLAPELVVRLWWLAGNRARAIDVARVRGAFAAAIERVGATEEMLARDLRVEWVHERRAALDHLGAVEAAWPDPALRSWVLRDVEAGIALGGPTAARLFAYLVAASPSDAAVDAALALVDAEDPDGRPGRERFVATFSELRCVDPALDRRLATAALRCAVREPAVGVDYERRVVRSLRERADALAVADLPSTGARAVPPATEPVRATALEPGQVPVFDAVCLPNRVVLVALGELGVRLLTPDGRVRNRWPVPAHQLAVADDGGSAILVARRGDDCVLQRLDVAARRVRPWTSVRAAQVLPSFDGGLLPIVDEDGLAFLDVGADPPRALWREFDREAWIVDVARSPDSLAALVTLPPARRGDEPLDQVWRWDLPSMTLRARTTVALGDATSTVLLASGRLFLQPSGEDVLREAGVGGGVPLDPRAELASSGEVLATMCPSPAGLEVAVGANETPPLAQVTLTDCNAARLREHAGIVTVWDHAGRVVALDRASRTVVANLRTTL